MLTVQAVSLRPSPVRPPVLTGADRSPASGVITSSDDEHRRFVDYRRTGDRRLRNELVDTYQWLVGYCARRFAGRGEPIDDLVQVAQLGLLKAIERYDPDHGSTFAAYATPTLFGELKRHFRDKTWPVRVPRRASDLIAASRLAVDPLSQSLSRAPTVAELARYLHVPEEDLHAALDAGTAYRSQPLLTDGSQPDQERGRPRPPLAVEEDALDPARLDLRRALRTLSDDEQRIVYLRFYEGLTQSAIADRLGASQVAVSRRLRRIFRQLEAATG